MQDLSQDKARSWFQHLRSYCDNHEKENTSRSCKFLLGEHFPTRHHLISAVHYVIVITRAEDIMADNSPSPRAQPEEEYYYHHHILGNGL